MKKKHIGFIIILIAIILTGLVQGSKMKEDKYIDTIIKTQGGSCYLEDGTCLHNDRNYVPFIVGWITSGTLLILGLYLLFFDKAQQQIEKQNLEISNALKEARQQNNEKDKFEAFISSFNKDEQSVLRAIHDQEGIQQSTLRYKTGMSKTSLSLLLKALEDREIISKSQDGKTNKVFLRKKF
ncbi:MarR family transcriptional regulator [Candidatus Woesearchaeota archaeon]|nr:MarR family transcriptional regulator [Candidatus Woesearchaeota archaeon]MCF7900601.1 MarR family transcriptional regulator [Candidatus Woesearchaeota archaeon]MCF8013909.1 MarR family transcriptional regulator [Candidatus Woesearchaeota archaeon]